MKITNIITQWIKVPYNRPFYPTWFPGRAESHQSIFLVRIQTDEGYEGWGSTECPFSLAPTYIQMVQDIVASWLIGQDPTMVERLAFKLKGDARLACRTWTIENALWDLFGKICNQPTYKVLGAYREKILAYAAWSEMRSHEERREDAQRLVDEGWKGVKLRIFANTIKQDIAEVENIRKAVGDKLAIMVDANQGVVRDRNFCDNGVPFWTYERALKTAKELEQLDVEWLEEPLDHYDYYGLSRLTEHTDIAIAGGEIYHGIGEHKILIESNCYDIIQPNLSMVGGFSQLRKIAVLAEHHGNKMCNIHGWTPGVGVAANVHFMCSIPNATWLEVPYDAPAILPENFQGIVKDPLVINPKDGCLYPTQKSGFGIELDEDIIKKYLVLEKQF